MDSLRESTPSRHIDSDLKLFYYRKNPSSMGEEKQTSGIGPGLLGLNNNGKPCFVFGGFPGSELAVHGKFLPIQPQDEEPK